MGFEPTLLLAIFLYVPPLWVLVLQGLLRRRDRLVRPIPAFTVVILLGGLMLWVYPYFWFAFYIASFMLLYGVAYAKNASYVSSFSVGVYGVFALADLWEIPIHLTSWVSLDTLVWGLAFSGWNWLALGLFFATLRWRAGWSPSGRWILGLALTLLAIPFLWGFALPNSVYNAQPCSLEFNQLRCWILGLYRLPWLALLVGAILGVRPKRLNKNIMMKN